MSDLTDFGSRVRRVEPDTGTAVESDPADAVEATLGDFTDSGDPTDVPDVPISDLVADDVPDTLDVERALNYGGRRDPYRRHVVAELTNRGRTALARRVASCGNSTNDGQCFECDRPRLCPDCASHPGGRAQEAYAPEIEAWDSLTMLALTMPETTEHPGVVRHDVLETFDRYRRRDRFEETIAGAFGGPHVVEESEGKYRAHIDLLVDVRPDRDLADLWRECGGGVVNQEPVGMSDSESWGVAVRKVSAYVTEKADVSPSARVDLALLAEGERHYRSVGF